MLRVLIFSIILLISAPGTSKELSLEEPKVSIYSDEDLNAYNRKWNIDPRENFEGVTKKTPHPLIKLCKKYNSSYFYRLKKTKLSKALSAES